MSQKNFIRPQTRKRTDAIKEKNSYFLCPSNTVLTGRCHSGDENGKTWYEYSTLAAFDENNSVVQGNIIVDDIQWSPWFKESSGNGYDAVENRVLVGRQHNGDENGQTRYATAIIKFNGKEVSIVNQITSDSIKESRNVWVSSDANRFMTGRHHSGDENGQTFYHFSEAQYSFQTSDRAPEGTRLVPDIRQTTASQKESNSYFLCPSNCVMTGRKHDGDENGDTIYEYASLKAIDAEGNKVEGVISVKNIVWIYNIVESYGLAYDAPCDKVIVGRSHKGDENGETGYAIGEVFFNGFPTTIIGYEISAPLHESDGVWFNSDKDHVVTGRHHYGDENGTTYYGVGIISCDARKDSNEEVVIHVKHDSEEKYLPMNPEDYVRLCRLRRHNGGGASDDGFNKETKTFVNGNAKTKEYYDIPISLLSTFHLYGKHELLNLRPKDINSIGTGELFLQPDDHLNGTREPNGRVAAMKYSDKNKISYWLFWGYDLAEVDILGFGYPKLKGNHEGDWEHLIIELDENNRIKSATLSQHTSTVTYNASELEIVHGATKDELTVYCANGSHALYNKPGTFSDNVKIGHDVADGLGCDWVITEEVKSLNDDSAPWKYFSGGWGEVGNFAFTTGPLGPWQKCGGLEKDVQKHNNPSVGSLLKAGELLLIYDNLEKETRTCKESAGGEMCASQNQMLYSRKHSDDENGISEYKFSGLHAIDINGETIKGNITIEDLEWSEWHIQSDSADFFLSTDLDDKSRVLTGRQHTEDENGMTRYQTGIVKFNGKKAKVTHYPEADLVVRESGGLEVLPKDNLVMIGIKHSGDENGLTTYCQGYIVIS